MAVTLVGNGGVVADVDEDRNIKVYQSIPGYPAAGGYYAVTGKSGTAAIAAALATDVTLMSARMITSTRRAYITKMRVTMNTLTPGAAGGVPSVLGLQRISAATPSGGTLRIPSRLGGTAKGSSSDITDVRDNNAALTVTGVTFGEELGWCVTPTMGTLLTVMEWIFEPTAPIELASGDGVCLRTRQVGPATATWYFTYAMHWFER